MVVNLLALASLLGLPLLAGLAFGFSTGAPGSSCLALYPKHGVTPQNPPSPFSISVTPSTSTPSQIHTVVIEGASDLPFAGLALSVRRPSGSFDDEELLGSFNVSGAEGKLKAVDCLGGIRNFVTHANSTPTSRLAFTWTAPGEITGPMEFRATIVQSKLVFWVEVKATVQPADPASTATPPRENPPVTGSVPSFNLTTCGSQKSCILHPPECRASPSTCTKALAFSSNGSDVTFEVFSDADAYVAVGLSDDTMMGGDDVVACVADGDTRMEVQHGYNPSKYYFWQYRRGLHDLSVKKEDGKVFCRFTRPSSMAVFTNNGTKTFSLNQRFHVLLAWGGIYPGIRNSVLQHHSQMPLVTSAMVDFEGNATVYQWASRSSGHGNGQGHGHVDDNNGNDAAVTKATIGVISVAALALYMAV